METVDPTPIDQENTTPEEQENTTPEEQENTTPEEQENTTPEEPENTTPEEQENTTPEEPENTTPEEPENTTPEEPENTTPEEPENDVPQTWHQTIIDRIKRIDALDFDIDNHSKLLVVMFVFYAICWALIDKTDIDIYSNWLCLLNAIVSSIVSVLFLIEPNPIYTSIFVASCFSNFLLELIVGTIWYPSRMPISTGYIHHICYIFVLIILPYYFKTINFCTLYGLSEIPTIIMNLVRMFHIKNTMVEIVYALIFLVFRLIAWVIYCAYGVLYFSGTVWFKATYGICAVGTTYLHVDWFIRIIKKLYKNCGSSS
jgi:hypothetical protein